MNIRISSSYRQDFSVLLLSLFVLLAVICCTTSYIHLAVAETQDSINSNNQTSLLGQLVYEAHGKIVGERNVGVRGPDGSFKTEASYTGTGSFKGVNVTEMWTFLNTHRPDGVIQGVGHGTVNTKDHSENATAEGYGRGYLVEGKIQFPTVQLYSTNSTGKLSFLKTFIGLSKWKVDEKSKSYTYKLWQLN